ncbi:MAG: DUF1566 domain-containing protein [Alphaproteobacteria bacterium]|nr:DUF1566 domain-containing protein [Alphaproteobacteria bacterium]
MHSLCRTTSCYIGIFCLLLVISSPVLARTTPTLGQKDVGQPCGNLESSSDFDALVQCTSSAAGTSGVKQTAPFIIGTVTAPPYDATACDSSKAGMLQWTGSAFLGCDGSTWLALGEEAVNTATSPFSFIDQTGVAFDTTIVSNAITLAGFTGQLLASCNPSCTGIYRNGVLVGMSANFSAGDTIAIQLTSSSAGSTATTTSVTVGTTSSAIWTVTTAPNACVGTPIINTRCEDGTIYVGVSPDGNEKMYAAPCRSGGIWDGTQCTGSWGDTMPWNDGSSNFVATGFTSTLTGRANTAALVALGTSVSPAPYQAARFCDNLVAGGHNDWYLPSRIEAEILRVASNHGGALYLNFSNSGVYWTSTEIDANKARDMSQYSEDTNKNVLRYVWCVRRTSS